MRVRNQVCFLSKNIRNSGRNENSIAKWKLKIYPLFSGAKNDIGDDRITSVLIALITPY